MGKGKRVRTERAAERAERAIVAAQEARIGSADFSRKLNRAKAQIDTLEESIQGWLQGNAYALVEELEPETGEYVLKAKITEPPSDQWPLIVGETVHNLRSALDHIAYSMAFDGYKAQHPGGSGIPANHQRRIMFPIVAASNDARLTVEQFYAQVAVGQLRYVPGPAAASIEGLQPYKRSAGNPTGDPLWVINELDVLDKHRKLATVAIANPLQSLQIGGGDVHIKKLYIGGGPVEHDSEIMRWAIEGIGGASVKMERQFARFVALGEGPGESTRSEIVWLLRSLHNYVANTVLPELTPFL